MPTLERLQRVSIDIPTARQEHYPYQGSKMDTRAAVANDTNWFASATIQVVDLEVL